MRLLFVNGSLSGGGSERVMTVLANKMAQQGYDVSMILFFDSPNVYKVDTNIKIISLQNNEESYLKRITRITKLRKLIKNSYADVVISFMTTLNIYTILASFGLNKKIIVSERADPKRRKMHNRLAERLLYMLTNNVVFQTEYAKKCYFKSIQKKGVVISNPIDISLLTQYDGERDHRIVSIGRLTEQKNFTLLINAFSKFNETEKDYELCIFGEGPLRNKLERQINDLGISDKVTLKGHVNNLPELICNAAMYVNSSDYEGISNAMLESMAMGLPTICTDCPVGGARMVIENGINGLLVPVNNSEALTSAMLEIVNNDTFANILSQKAKDIRSKYSIDKIVEQWNSLL